MHRTRWFVARHSLQTGGGRRDRSVCSGQQQQQQRVCRLAAKRKKPVTSVFGVDMVKLSAELIEQAAQYTNPVRDRELDLRG